MLRNSLVGRIEKMTALTNSMSHHKAFADRVEKFVCDEFDVSPIALRIRCRSKPLPDARFVLFYILYQPGKTYRRRSQGWLARRYNTDPWSVQYGLKKVSKNEDLQRRAITVMALLERELELELFGPRRGDQDASREEPRGCDTLL